MAGKWTVKRQGVASIIFVLGKKDIQVSKINLRRREVQQDITFGVIIAFTELQRLLHPSRQQTNTVFIPNCMSNYRMKQQTIIASVNTMGIQCC